MTSLRERLRRWFRQPADLPREAAPFSYRIFWTREVRTWSLERRRQVREDVGQVAAAPGFDARGVGRRFRVPALGGGVHAGASLAALLEVLRAFAHEAGGMGGEEHGGRA